MPLRSLLTVTFAASMLGVVVDAARDGEEQGPRPPPQMQITVREKGLGRKMTAVEYFPTDTIDKLFRDVRDSLIADSQADGSLRAGDFDLSYNKQYLRRLEKKKVQQVIKTVPAVLELIPKCKICRDLIQKPIIVSEDTHVALYDDLEKPGNNGKLNARVCMKCYEDSCLDCHADDKFERRRVRDKKCKQRGHCVKGASLICIGSGSVMAVLGAGTPPVAAVGKATVAVSAGAFVGWHIGRMFHPLRDACVDFRDSFRTRRSIIRQHSRYPDAREPGCLDGLRARARGGCGGGS